jgi:hypothetical protein
MSGDGVGERGFFADAAAPDKQQISLVEGRPVTGMVTFAALMAKTNSAR